MKKMIVSVVAIAFGVVANAATVSWAISGVSEGGSALTKGHTYMFFAASEAAANTAIAALGDLNGASAFTTAMNGAAWNDTKKATAAGNFGIGTSAALGSYTLPTNTQLGLDGEKTYYAYAVIFDTETITDESKYIVSNVKSVTTLSNDSALNRAISFGSQSSATWNTVAVPEPTSGLLLLLGMAGLALKRKRA